MCVYYIYTHICISQPQSFRSFQIPSSGVAVFCSLIVWFGTVLQKLYKQMSLKSKESITDRLVNNPYSITC